MVQPCSVPAGTQLELPAHPPADVLLHRDACPWDRDSSVGGSPTCLAPLAVLLSPPSFSSQGLLVVPGLQGDSQGTDVSDEGKWRLQFCGPVSAPARMSSRILNNHLDAGSLENVKPQSVVVLDTPTTGWLMASPGAQWNCRVSTQVLCTEITRNPEDHIACEYEIYYV